MVITSVISGQELFRPESQLSFRLLLVGDGEEGAVIRDIDGSVLDGNSNGVAGGDYRTGFGIVG